MKPYIKFLIFELMIVLILLLFCICMINISDNGNPFIPNYIIIHAFIPKIFLVIFGCLLCKLATIVNTPYNETSIFSILNLIMFIVLMTFNLLILNSVVSTNNFSYFWNSLGSGHMFILAGFNIAYSIKGFKDYIINKKSSSNDIPSNKDTP